MANFKSCSSMKPPEGHAEKQDFNVVRATSKYEGNYLSNVPKGIGGLADGLSPYPGGPFSALTPSMWPQDILSKLGQPKEAHLHSDYRFDEFGFRVEDEDGPYQSSNKLPVIPFVEDPQLRLQWVSYLGLSPDEDGNLTWDNIGAKLSVTGKFKSMVQAGIPHSLRPQMWMRLSGALKNKLSREIIYKNILEVPYDHASSLTSKQIEKDLLRAMPENACYSQHNSIGVPRLRRVLQSLAVIFPKIGYSQATSIVASSLLLFMEEEDAFWMIFTMIVNYPQKSFYTSGHSDNQQVLRILVKHLLPHVDAALREHDIELSLITFHWFLTLFASVVHMKVLLRIWDLLFLNGYAVLFQISLGILKIKEPYLINIDKSANIFNILSDISGDVDDADHLFQVSKELWPGEENIKKLLSQENKRVGNHDVAINSGFQGMEYNSRCFIL